ncbi:hypothetical protein OG523_02260 [Streptomyces virginiae]|uniref:hypothetical protein n=1 Tax=Streptomyces virginiae TaxID=1961 RepID=UPI002E335FD6|nr:hypothetical protein [Streptomyces virginiae]
MQMTQLNFGSPYSTTFGGGWWSIAGRAEFDLDRGFLVLGIDSTPQRFIVRPRRTKPARPDLLYGYPLPTQGRPWLSYVAMPISEVSHVEAVSGGSLP